METTDDGFLPLFRRRVVAAPDRVFARFAEADYTFADMDRMSAALAQWFRTQGVGAGDVVALMIANSPLAVGLLLAIARAGAVWVPVNAHSVGDNLAYILDHAAPRLVIADEDCVPAVAACGAHVDGNRLFTTAQVRTAIAASSAPIEPEPAPAADAPYAIMYTSGTTGRPKGVIVSHRMLRLSGEGAALVAAAEPGDVMYMWEPLYHIGGAQMIVVPLIRDVSLYFSERFSARRFWSEVQCSGASHIHFLGGILQILLKQPPSDLDRAHGVRIAWGGGCPREIWRPFEERFGVTIRECYGMTECSSITTANRNGTLGSVGTPMPWFDVEIVRPDGTPVAIGEQGEIVVRTSLPGALTQGYLRNPEATAKALRKGAFHTGDLGSWDHDGNMYFHGRMTDSVRVKGENVSAFEVEHVAGQHPAVEECAMVGVAADIGEQEIKLFVKPRAGMAVGAAELSDWLAARLAPYQRPRYLAIIEDFERTPSQRIMKHRLSRHTNDCWDRLGGRDAGI